MQQWDYRLFSAINSIAGHSKFLNMFMVTIAKWGPIFYGLILLVLFFGSKDLLRKTENRKTVIKAVFAAGVSLLINQIIGFAYFRPRPFATHHVHLLLDRSPDPSFPSDHATGASSLSFTVLSTNPAIGVLMLLFMLLLMVSRVYVGTHYPLDVIGGMMTGILGSYLVHKLWPFCDGLVTKLLDLWEASTVKIFGGSANSHQE